MPYNKKIRKYLKYKFYLRVAKGKTRARRNAWQTLKFPLPRSRDPSSGSGEAASATLRPSPESAPSRGQVPRRCWWGQGRWKYRSIYIHTYIIVFIYVCVCRAVKSRRTRSSLPTKTQSATQQRGRCWKANRLCCSVVQTRFSSSALNPCSKHHYGLL